MPWKLDTPVAVGDLDPNGPYTEVQIVVEQHDSRRHQIQLGLEYGNTVGGVWVPGKTPASRRPLYTVKGQNYIDFIVAHQALYDAVKDALYVKLNDDGIVADGEVV